MTLGAGLDKVSPVSLRKGPVNGARDGAAAVLRQAATIIAAHLQAAEVPTTKISVGVLWVFNNLSYLCRLKPITQTR